MTGALLNEFLRVSPRRRCPVCGKPDWCLLSRRGGDDPVSSICARVESDHRWGEAGWFHGLREPTSSPRPWRRHAVIPVQSDGGLGALAMTWAGRCDDRQVAGLAKELKVEMSSLRRLAVGWSGSAWSFPMSDAEGRAIGIHLRRPDAGKLAVKGSKNGLFLPIGLSLSEVLVVTEGATDTAAMLALGFEAVGRSSCTGNLEMIRELVHRGRPRTTVVAADNDAPGQRGAWRLAAALRAVCRDVRVITPPQPVKDVRAWRALGASKVDVERVIHEATPIKMILSSRRRRR